MIEMAGTISGVIYSSLAGESLDRLNEAMKKAGMSVAYSHLAEPIVAEVDGQIVGFCFAQLIPHFEPLYVMPEWRGTGIAEELAQRAMKKITDTGAQRFMCVVQSQFAEALCKKLGMRAVPGVVYVKDSEGG